MNPTQIGRLEVKVDGTLKHTVNVFRNGEGLQVEGNGFLQTGEYFGGQQVVINMATKKALRQYGDEVEVHYHHQ
jgi:hypothetical protein